MLKATILVVGMYSVITGLNALKTVDSVNSAMSKHNAAIAQAYNQ